MLICVSVSRFAAGNLDSLINKRETCCVLAVILALVLWLIHSSRNKFGFFWSAGPMAGLTGFDIGAAAGAADVEEQLVSRVIEAFDLSHVEELVWRNQCDQIWTNFVTWAKFHKSLWDFLVFFGTWQNFEPRYLLWQKNYAIGQIFNVV